MMLTNTLIIFTAVWVLAMWPVFVDVFGRGTIEYTRFPADKA